MTIPILASTDFNTLAEFRAAAESTTQPVLLQVEVSEVPKVATWLADKDDVCLVDSPDELVALRLQRLKKTLTCNQDPLTGVYSRQFLHDYLAEQLTKASENQPVSLILCDIDHFKLVNDKYGHQAGDQFLMEVGSVMSERADNSAAVGRVSGAAFAIVCNRGEEAARMLAEKLRLEVQEINLNEMVRTTASFGIATATEPTEQAEMLSDANQACYAAKSKGRNNCVSYGDLLRDCESSGQQHVDMLSLQHQARVMAERVANVITLRSRKLFDAARQEADVDALTGCYTRRYLDRRLQSEFDDAGELPLSVAFLDLDHFGRVNKQFGWPTGDKVLREVCQTVREAVRESDWIGRYGGEEFCVVMPGATMEEAYGILTRIREIVENTAYQSEQGDTVPVTLSIGAADVVSGDSSYKELLDRASKQAQRAKQEGRNRVCANV